MYLESTVTSLAGRISSQRGTVVLPAAGLGVVDGAGWIGSSVPCQS
jgi:hypothetical protein